MKSVRIGQSAAKLLRITVRQYRKNVQRLSKPLRKQTRE
ncbi:hypothetical protein KEN49_CDS0366 [Pseudomonas phage vB_Pae3705-KEN49]